MHAQNVRIEIGEKHMPSLKSATVANKSHSTNSQHMPLVKDFRESPSCGICYLHATAAATCYLLSNSMSHLAIFSQNRCCTMAGCFWGVASRPASRTARPPRGWRRPLRSCPLSPGRRAAIRPILVQGIRRIWRSIPIFVHVIISRPNSANMGFEFLHLFPDLFSRPISPDLFSRPIFAKPIFLQNW